MENNIPDTDSVIFAVRQKEEPVLTMAFVNMQPFGAVYDPTEGLTRGTIFPDLNKPFLMGGGNA